MPSEETLAKEAEMANKFAAADAAQKRLGFSLQQGKGVKCGARRRSEDAHQRRLGNYISRNGWKKR